VWQETARAGKNSLKKRRNLASVELSVCGVEWLQFATLASLLITQYFYQSDVYYVYLSERIRKTRFSSAKYLPTIYRVLYLHTFELTLEKFQLKITGIVIYCI
jgi:hypothetical protein